LFYILFGYSRVKAILVILQLLGMGHGFYFINKSYLVYGSLCMGFGLIQLGFDLLVKLRVA